MLYIIGRQAAYLLVMFNKTRNFFAETVDVLVVTDNFYLASARNQLQFRKLFAENIQVGIVDTKKFNRIQRINGYNYFTQDCMILGKMNS